MCSPLQITLFQETYQALLYSSFRDPARVVPNSQNAVHGEDLVSIGDFEAEHMSERSKTLDIRENARFRIESRPRRSITQDRTAHSR